MAVTFGLPSEIEQRLRQQFGDLDQTAKEAALVELYRQHKLTHHELAEALGRSRFSTDELLKQHGVNYDITLEEIRSESRSLRQAGK
jgi:hypothetical protein